MAPMAHFASLLLRCRLEEEGSESVLTAKCFGHLEKHTDTHTHIHTIPVPLEPGVVPGE